MDASSLLGAISEVAADAADTVSSVSDALSSTAAPAIPQPALTPTSSGSSVSVKVSGNYTPWIIGGAAILILVGCYVAFKK